MPQHVPFHRIAIFDPVSETKDPQAWLATAHARGADAVYLRWNPACTPALAQDIMEALSRFPSLRTLAATEYQAWGLQPDAWHLRAATPQGQIPPGALWAGRSCHSIRELLQAEKEGLDYAFLSPVFSTLTHPEATPLGLETLAEACRSADLVVFALGGINAEREVACLAHGAYGIAGIRMFCS